MRGKRIVLGLILVVSIAQIKSYANTTNDIMQNNIINSQNITNEMNNSILENTIQNINNSNTASSLDSSNETINSYYNATNNDNSTKIITKEQEKSNYSTMNYKKTAIQAEKTKDNGIYKIAVGSSPNKTIEIAGSNTEDNAKVDIWNYRKCISTKILFKI